MIQVLLTHPDHGRDGSDLTWHHQVAQADGCYGLRHVLTPTCTLMLGS